MRIIRLRAAAASLLLVACAEPQTRGPVAPQAGSGLVASLDLSNAQAAVGSDVLVTVHVEGESASSLATMTARIMYDTVGLSFAGEEPIADGAERALNPLTGALRFAVAASKGFGAGRLYALHFTVRQAGSLGSLALSIDEMHSATGTDMRAALVPGSGRPQGVASALGRLALPTVGARRTAGRVVENIEQRDEWFWSQRSDASGVPEYAKLYAMRQALVSRGSAMHASASIAAPLAGSWRSIGPNTLLNGGWIASGRVNVIVPAKVAGGPMYAGTASGGVWRSTNNGATWSPLTDAQCALTTGAVAVDPVNSANVYVGTGDGDGGLTGCGVLKSADGGATWSNSATTSNYFTMLVDSASAGSTTTSVILAATVTATGGGVARSTNSGATWTTPLSVGPVTSLVAHPTHGGTYYAAASSAQSGATTPAAARGVYRSTDAGATWTKLPALPVTDQTTIDRIELAVSKASPNSVWALVGNASTSPRTLLGLFRWDDSSSTWTTLSATGLSQARFNQEIYDLVVAVDPSNASRIYVAGITAFRSVDDGATFASMGDSPVHVDWHSIAFDPNDPSIVWAGTDGGVYLSTDAGDTWVSRNAGLAITQFYPGIGVAPNGSRIIGGTQDNGTLIYTGSLYWDQQDGGDGGYTALNDTNPDIQWTVRPFLSRKDPGATGFGQKHTGIVSTDPTNGLGTPLVIDPVNRSKLYYGTNRLYRTVNNGELWAPITNVLTTGGVITSIAVSPADTNTIYVSTDGNGRALVSRDGGTTFTAATGLPQRIVTRIIAHPTDPLRALIVLSGFGSPHILETTDGFATAPHSITGDLMDVPVSAAAYIPAATEILIGTDLGVFQTINGGTNWTAGPSGMPTVIVHDLVYRSESNLLVAATYGRGMFAFDVGGQAAVLRGDVDGDGTITAHDALLVQQALAGSAPAGTAVFPRGDANCNNTLDAADVTLILRAAVGLSTGTACVGTIH